MHKSIQNDSIHQEHLTYLLLRQIIIEHDRNSYIVHKLMHSWQWNGRGRQQLPIEKAVKEGDIPETQALQILLMEVSLLWRSCTRPLHIPVLNLLSKGGHRLKHGIESLGTLNSLVPKAMSHTIALNRLHRGLKGLGFNTAPISAGT